MLSSTFIVFKILPISFCTQFPNINVLPTNYIIFSFFCCLFCFLIPFCKTSMAINHSYFHAFNLVNEKHWKKVITSTYSWNVESTYDLIDSLYFQDCLNNFDYCYMKATLGKSTLQCTFMEITMVVFFGFFKSKFLQLKCI